MRAIGVSHTACKDEFRRNLRSQLECIFIFYNIPGLSDLRGLCLDDVAAREPNDLDDLLKYKREYFLGQICIVQILHNRSYRHGV